MASRNCLIAAAEFASSARKDAGGFPEEWSRRKIANVQLERDRIPARRGGLFLWMSQFRLLQWTQGRCSISRSTTVIYFIPKRLRVQIGEGISRRG